MTTLQADRTNSVTPISHTESMADRLLTPSKITAWLDCAHFLTLQHEVEGGACPKPSSSFGEMAQMLVDKGNEHERTVLEGYRAEGLSVYEVPERDKKNESFQQWVDRVGDVLADRHDVVFQMPFIHEGIQGIADFLRRVDDPKATGSPGSRSTPSWPARKRSPATCCSCASTPRRLRPPQVVSPT
jgi:hypothetical protein